MNPRFCVLSLNPAIDVEWRVDDLRWEEKNLVLAQRRWAGGKGANVARWLNFLGGQSELLVPLGGRAGEEMDQCLRAEALRARVVQAAGETRTNVVITGRDGRQMRFNQPGTFLTKAGWRHILDYLMQRAEQGADLILSGSLAPGLSADSYAKVLQEVRRTGVKVFVDCDGEALKRAVAQRPFLVKPNQHELAQWAGKQLRSLRSVRDAALAMSRATRAWVLVSLGAKGALLVNAADGSFDHVGAGTVRVINTLGAGDATLAGAAYAVSRGDTPRDWLRMAVAAGTAATQCEPGRIVSKDVFRRILKSL